MSSTHLPVTISFKRWPEKQKIMYWVKTNPYFFSPKLFTSPFVTGLHTTREGDFPDVKFIIADSGGYQFGIGRRKVQKSVMEIFEWQQNKIKADGAMIVDVPPFDENNKYQKDRFIRHMEETKRNGDKMKQLQTREDMILYGVVQGRPLEDLRQWYNRISEDHEYERLGIPVRVSRWYEPLAFAKEIGKPTHFLGASFPFLMLISAKLSYATGIEYSFDSSSTSKSLELGKYVDPFFNSSSISYSKDKIEARSKISKNPCNCPVCSNHTHEEICQNSLLMYVHNVFAFEQYNQYLNAIVEDDVLFKLILKKQIATNPRLHSHKNEILNKVYNLIYDEELLPERKLSPLNSFFDDYADEEEEISDEDFWQMSGF